MVIKLHLLGKSLNDIVSEVKSSLIFIEKFEIISLYLRMSAAFMVGFLMVVGRNH